MKKICIVTTVSLTLKSFVVDTAVYLHEECGYDVTLICDEDRDFASSLPKAIHYVPVPMSRGINFSGFSAIKRLVEIFKQEKFDLVQYSTPNAACYASIASFLTRVPVRLYCQWGMAYVGFRGIKRKIFKTIEKLVCCLSTWVEPDSFGNLKFSHEEGLYPEEKGSVVWNGSASGVNLEKFNVEHKSEWRIHIRNQYGILENAFVFGFIGRITGDKGINELFSAFRNVLTDSPDSYLMLVGNTEKTDSVDDSLYQWAQNEPHILFCGYTSVVEQYLSAMDVYVLPSYREGFGSAVVEAEAMAVPVIVTDIPGPTDAMRKDETGLVVKKADVASLQNAMQQMQNNKDRCRAFGAAGYEFASSNFEQKQLFQHIAEDRQRLLENVNVNL